MKKDLRPVLRGTLACLFLGGTALSVLAQNTPGITDKMIAIGSCSALEGPSHFLGTETAAGANAYFSLINDEGGVNGRQLKLIAYDDSYDPAKTKVCFERLLNDKVFAMGFFVGTPTAVKYVPLAEASKIPLVGLFTGAQTLYVPLRHWVINVRASYYDETREQMDGVWDKLGYHNVGVILPKMPSAVQCLPESRKRSRHAAPSRPKLLSMNGKPRMSAVQLIPCARRTRKPLC